VLGVELDLTARGGSDCRVCVATVTMYPHSAGIDDHEIGTRTAHDALRWRSLRAAPREAPAS